VTGVVEALAPRPIILDCDPGHDDAVAILLAHGSPAVELRAITTVAGNQTLAKVTENARRVATLAGLAGVPIAAGCDRPLVRDPVLAPDIHGETGLDGPALPEPRVPLDRRHAVDLIIELLLASEGEITLVPTGPLTNIALAMRREPRILPRIREIVLMGGGFSKGNRTPAAEFNIYADPEAAHIVFTSGVPLTMVGLDLTHQALATEAVMARLRVLPAPLGPLVADLLSFFGRSYQQVYGFPAPPVHDACAVARVIDPSLVACRPAHTAIELRGEHTYGMTVCDFLGRTGRPPNSQVAVQLDVARFWDTVIDALGRVADAVGGGPSST
jgi:purine nucleosidase